MKISVAIPAYEMHGFGGVFLRQAFASIALQTHKDVEVIVGDQANSTVVAQACADWSGCLSITRVDTRYCRGNPSANVNAAAAAATGDIIKILFQDDLLAGPAALASIAAAFEAEPQKAWLVSAIEHTFDGIVAHRPFFPVTQKRLRYGVNTFGPPSAIAMRRASYLEFDAQLSWMMDVELYGRLLDTYGPPLIAGEIGVVSREWARQNTHQLDDARKYAEEAASLGSSAYRSQRLPTPTIARAHENVTTSLVDEARTVMSQDTGAAIRAEALNRVGDALPIDYDVLNRIYSHQTIPGDSLWRRAAALLISYHATEPAALLASDALQRMTAHELDELAPFARSLGTYSRPTGYATRLMPNWFEAPGIGADEGARIRGRISSALAISHRQSNARSQRTLEQATSLLGACLQRASGLAGDAGLPIEPLIEDQASTSIPRPSSREGGAKSGIVVVLDPTAGERDSGSLNYARSKCELGGYLLHVRLSGIPSVAPASLRLPDERGAMVTVEQVFA